jgi:ABC-type Mn2+/Zn2+ transport system permease subunit
MTAQMFVGLLVEGAILAVPLILIAFLLSRFIRDIIGRSLLVVFLFAAAGAYFGFALLAAPGPIWVLAELVQVIIFGVIALLGLRGSP